MSLVVDRLIKNYGAFQAVKGVSFTVKAGEFVSLLGPSGCGKTTTLRCIAGFEHPNGGSIILNGESLVNAASGTFRPPNKRNFGMVFQSYAVWPHMTVEDNVAYPLKVKGGFSRDEIRARVAETLRIVGLAASESRYPTQLSGGQQQRVALARALIMEPRALLFDEPLSNLDAKLRERMRFELIEIQSKLGIPALYVTHDQAEAMVMSRTIIVMEHGRIAQAGSPEEIYARPKSRFVADFIGLSNFVEGRVVGAAGDDHWIVRTNLGDLVCSSDDPVTPGRDVVLAVRPEAIRLSVQDSRLPNSIRTTLQSRYFLGPHSEYFIGTDDTKLRAQTSEHLSVAPGATLYARIDPEDCHILSEELEMVKATEAVASSKKTRNFSVGQQFAGTA